MWFDDGEFETKIQRRPAERDSRRSGSSGDLRDPASRAIRGQAGLGIRSVADATGSSPLTAETTIFWFEDATGYTPTKFGSLMCGPDRQTVEWCPERERYEGGYSY